MPIIKHFNARLLNEFLNLKVLLYFANLERNYIRFKSFRFSNLGIRGDTELTQFS